MKTIFLVDGDNNIGTGLTGVDMLSDQDTVLIFYQRGKADVHDPHGDAPLVRVRPCRPGDGDTKVRSGDPADPLRHDIVYGVDGGDLADCCHGHLIRRGLTLATAESCLRHGPGALL